VAPFLELTMRSAFRHALLLAAALLAQEAHAADACRPVRVLPLYSTVRFSPQEFELLPRLRLVSQQAITVAADAAAIPAVAPAGTRLTQPLLMPAQVLGYAPFSAQSASLQFDGAGSRATPSGANGSVYVSVSGHRYVVHVNDGIARTADGSPLRLQAPLTTPTPFTVAPGALVMPAKQGQLKLAAGAQLEWAAEDYPGGLEATLASAARLEQASPADAVAHLEVLTPRMFAGAVMRVKVVAPGFDTAGKVLAFCFGGPRTGEGATVSAAGRLIEQKGDGALYEVRLPAELADGAGGVDIGGWLLGRTARLRVVGYDGADVALDASGTFVVSSFSAAIVAGLLLLVLLCVLGGLFAGRVNPFAALRVFIQRSDGAYSLSNFQVMLWTLLVIFSLCFVWAGSGQLLAISPGILVLLGISGGSSVLARAIDKTDAAGPPREGAFSDLVRDRDGNFDLLRFQMLGFTLFTWLYSLVSVLRFEGLPEIPDNLYLLMGVSNAAYLGGKVAPKLSGSSADSAAGAAENLSLTDAERALTPDDIKKLQAAVGAPATGQLDEATRAAVAGYKQRNGIAPANGRVNRFLLKNLAVA
jgi:hypothetical protein